MLGQMPASEGPKLSRKWKPIENATIFIPSFRLGHLLIPDTERVRLNWAEEGYQESDKPEELLLISQGCKGKRGVWGCQGGQDLKGPGCRRKRSSGK